MQYLALVDPIYHIIMLWTHSNGIVQFLFVVDICVIKGYILSVALGYESHFVVI